MNNDIKTIARAMFEHRDDDCETMRAIRRMGLEGPVLSYPNLVALVKEATRVKGCIDDDAERRAACHQS